MPKVMQEGSVRAPSAPHQGPGMLGPHSPLTSIHEECHQLAASSSPASFLCRIYYFFISHPLFWEETDFPVSMETLPFSPHYFKEVFICFFQK